MRQVGRNVGISMMLAVGLLLAGCGQEIKKENAALKTETMALKGDNEAMKKQLDEMKQHMEQMQKQMKAGKPARKR